MACSISSRMGVSPSLCGSWDLTLLTWRLIISVHSAPAPNSPVGGYWTDGAVASEPRGGLFVFQWSVEPSGLVKRAESMTQKPQLVARVLFDPQDVVRGQLTAGCVALRQTVSDSRAQVHDSLRAGQSIRPALTALSSPHRSTNPTASPYETPPPPPPAPASAAPSAHSRPPSPPPRSAPRWRIPGRAVSAA